MEIVGDDPGNPLFDLVDRAAALYEVDPEKLVFLDDSENGCAYDYIKGDHGL